jgi:hypothetical protein
MNPVRYELNFRILFRRNSVCKVPPHISLHVMFVAELCVPKSSGLFCEPRTEAACLDFVREVKVKFSPCLIKHCTMQTYGLLKV